MTLISRQPRVESGVQVITVSDYLNRRLLDDHIPPARSRLSGKTVHRESLVIQADYDAHIPPSVIRIQCHQSIEIQAEYDAQIPPRLDRLHARLINSQAQYEPQSPPN